MSSNDLQRTDPHLSPVPARSRYELRVADRVWLAAHDLGADGVTLTPRIAQDVLALACAGGLLAELVVDGVVGCGDTVGTRTPERPVALERYVSEDLYAEIDRDVPRSVRWWISQWWQGADADVRWRLLRRRAVTEHREALPRWRGGGSRYVWRTTRAAGSTPDHDVATQLSLRGSVMRGPGVITVRSHLEVVTLACLALVTGLLRHMDLDQTSPQDRSEVRDQTWAPDPCEVIGGWRTRLPPALQQVVDEVESLLGEVALRP